MSMTSLGRLDLVHGRCPRFFQPGLVGVFLESVVGKRVARAERNVFSETVPIFLDLP